MIISPVDPLSIIIPSVNATIKILEVTYQLKAVDDQAADLLSTTRHVDFMVKEAHRLRRLKAGLLNTSERTMIDRVISDTEDALQSVARLVESCRVDKATKKGIRFGHRVMWVFRDNPNVRDKHQKLQVCHQSLSIAFACLYSKDVVVIAPAPEPSSEDQPPPYDPQLKELLGWQNRRKGRKSQEGREGHTTENIVEMKAGSSNTTIADALNPRLMDTLDKNSGASGLSSHLPEMFFELSTTSTPDLPSLVSHEIAPNLNLAATSPESHSRSHISKRDLHAYAGFQQGTASATKTDGGGDCFNSTYKLAEIDSPPFATMMASFTLNNNDEDGQEYPMDNPAHESFPAIERTSISSATTPCTNQSKASLPPALSFSAIATPTLSSFNAGHDGGIAGMESPGANDYDEPAEAASPGLNLTVARISSNTQSPNSYQSDRLDAIARAEDVINRDKRAVSVGQGVMKRGGRSWLAYHATRSDVGHGIDWNG